MKTLFLGSTGFIGSALLRVLGRDQDLTLLVRQPNKTINLDQIIGDSNDSETLAKIIDLRFDRVIDCSWEGLPDLSESTNHSNLTSKLNLYKVLIESGAMEINSFGSCLEYGSTKGLVSEDTSGFDVSNFGNTKLKILEELERYEIPFRWFRLFYVIGVNQHSKSLINSAINSIQSGVDFTPRNPEASYDYISVDDAVRGVDLALNERRCNGVINLGSGKARSVNDVVNLVRRHYGIEERACINEPGMISDSRKIKSFTEWEPKVSIESEILNMITRRTAF